MIDKKTKASARLSQYKGWLGTGCTAVVVTLAIVVGGHRVFQLTSGSTYSFATVVVSDWQRFSSFGHRRGPHDATVTVVDFFDFTCPRCQDAALALAMLRMRYPDDVAVVHRHFPTNEGIALAAARASECAARFGLFLAFYDSVMATPKLIGTRHWTDWAEVVGVSDTTAFVTCMVDSAPGLSNIQSDTLAARELNIDGTPTFLVNNVLIKGYPGFEQLHDVVRSALRDAPDETSHRSMSVGEGAVNHSVLAAETAASGPEVWVFDTLWTVGPQTTDFIGARVFAESTIDVASTGSVYMLDHVARKVFVLSEHGELVDSLGREGSGPGEFCNPKALDLQGDSVLAVLDLCGAVIRWRLSDRSVEQTRAERMYRFMGPFSADEAGFIATEREMVGWNRTRDGRIYRLHVTRWTNGGEERMFSGRESVRFPFTTPPCVEGLTLPKLFEPQLGWARRDGVLVLAEDSLYSIHVIEPGREVAEIRRDISPRTVTESMARREEGDGIRRPDGCTLSTAEAIAGRGYSGYLQAVTDVRLGARGEIWVLRGKVNDEANVIDLFARTGEHLATLPVGSPFPAAFAPRDRILVTGRDEFGATLTMVRVIRPSDLGGP